jgi:hypothetical protein
VREESGVNEFTAPSISKMFDTLQSLMPIPLADHERKMPDRMPLDRADLAVELGFLIADGFLVVQAGQMNQVEELAKDLTRYGKALGAGDRVNRHSAALLGSGTPDFVGGVDSCAGGFIERGGGTVFGGACDEDHA